MVELQYFTKDNPMISIIRNYIVTQCSTICRDAISDETARHSMKNFDFGYINKTARAHKIFGKKSETVNSFILCKYVYRENIQQPIAVDIVLLCSNKNSQTTGKDMINMVYQKCLQEKIDTITLLLLGEEKLRNWYLRQGFIQLKEILTNDKKIKVYSMYKIVKI